MGDLIPAIEKAIDFGGSGYSCLNISTGEPCSINILADDISDLVPGCRVSYADVPQPVVRLDPARADTILGWRALPRRVRLQSMIQSIHNARGSD
jgi:nucleoside-diphosphate-sugar epimerase